MIFHYFRSIADICADNVDIPGGNDLPAYFPGDDDRGVSRGMRDTDSIEASYDRYLRSAVIDYSLSVQHPGSGFSLHDFMFGLTNLRLLSANAILWWSSWWTVF